MKAQQVLLLSTCLQAVISGSKCEALQYGKLSKGATVYDPEDKLPILHSMAAW